jgi:hypothetical protein
MINREVVKCQIELEPTEGCQEAEEQYECILEPWKDTDPGQPEVKDARKRLAGLKR